MLEKDLTSQEKTISEELAEKSAEKWKEFYALLREEREMAQGYPKSSVMALDLLMPKLKTLPWKSARSNSETFNDFVQDAYLVIAEHIGSYDDSRDCGFPTFIMKWLTGLARETRNDGASDYQIKQHNYRVYSTDALSANNDSEDNIVFEIEDKGSSIEDIVDAKEKEKANNLFRQALGNISYGDVEEKTDLYINAACYHKCLGGIYNDMPEQLKMKLAEKIQEARDRGDYSKDYSDEYSEEMII